MRSTLKLTVFATLTAVALTSAGCDGTAGPMMPGPGTPGPNLPGDPPGPGPQDPPKPPQAAYSGLYEVIAPIDFTQNGVLPGVLGPALAGLSQLHDKPGTAILTIAEGSGIPYLSDILKKIPSFLKSTAAALLDTLIKDNLYKGYPVLDQVASIIQGIAELAKKAEIYDDLTVNAPDASGNVALKQQLTGIGFTLLGKKTIVDFSAAAKAKAVANMPGVLVPHPNAPVADADLTLSSGKFTLPIGDVMLQAAGPLLFSNFGGATTLKGALQNLIPCMTIGQEVSDGLGGIISATDASNLCKGAVGLLADQVEQKIKAIVFDGVEVSRAQSKMFDVSMARPQMDYQTDRVAEGTWTWTFQVGMNKIDVPSTFSGDRVSPVQ